MSSVQFCLGTCGLADLRTGGLAEKWAPSGKWLSLKAVFASPLIYNLEQALAQAIENPINVTAIGGAEGILR